MIDREAISTALFALISGVSNFRTKSRRARIWGDVDPGQQPALFLIHTGESVAQEANWTLARYVLHYDAFVYTRVDPAPDKIPETELNALLDAFDNALQTKPPGGLQTLGGLVAHVWIEGEVMIDTGVLDQQCAIVVPIKVLSGI